MNRKETKIVAIIIAHKTVPVSEYALFYIVPLIFKRWI